MEEQIKRIEDMERRCDLAEIKINKLRDALEEYEEFLPELNKLIGYYNSKLWREDYQADEDGRIPQNLKRGVLAEDTIFNILTDVASIEGQMRDLVEGLI